MTENIKFVLQRAKYLGRLLTTDPVPQRVKILSGKDAGDMILKLVEIIENGR